MRPCIYALTDPNGEVRYIGQAKNIRVRLTSHRCPHGRTGDTHRNVWLRSLHERGERPGWFILDCPEDLNSAEIYWIAKYRAAGARLVNTADGGQTLGHASRAYANSRWAGKCTPIQRMVRYCTVLAKDYRRDGQEDKAVAIEQKRDAFKEKLAKAIRERGTAIRDSVNDMLADQYSGMA